MTHMPDCSRLRGNREDPKEIVLSAHNERGKLISIAHALQQRGGGEGDGEDRAYFCPDADCRAEMTPKAGARYVPIRTEKGDELIHRRAHFAALPDSHCQGPRRTRESEREDALDFIVSQMLASGLYHSPTGEAQVYDHCWINLEINRKEPTQEHQAGWGSFADYEADIVAIRPGGRAVLIQVEERPFGERYGNTALLNTRIRRLADPGKDKRRTLYDAQGKPIRELPPRIHQATVVLRNVDYFREEEEGTVPITSTTTNHVRKLMDNLYVLDLRGEALLVPQVEIFLDGHERPEPRIVGVEKIPYFAFKEKMYKGREDFKEVRMPVINRQNSHLLIPEMRVAEAVPIIYDHHTGLPRNQDAHGQPLLF